MLVFSATLGAGTLVFSSLLYWLLHQELAATWLAAAGLVTTLCSLVPGVGRIVYVVWIGFGVTLGLLTSPLIVLILYFLVLTPSALIMKLFGRDALQRKLEPRRSSYWEPYPNHDDQTRYLKQF